MVYSIAEHQLFLIALSFLHMYKFVKDLQINFLFVASVGSILVLHLFFISKCLLLEIFLTEDSSMQ